LFELRELSTRARLGLTWSSSVLPDEGVLNALQVECLNPCWVYLSERLVASAHERGLEVSTWTVDRPADMRLMLRLGVDSVVTNDVRTFVMTRMGA